MNPESPKNNRTVLVVCCLLVVAVAVVFGQTVRHDFVNYDDQAYVYENPQVSQGLTATTFTWSFTAFCGGNWHPLTLLSHAIDSQLYGTQNAAGHHLTNVVLHAAVVVLLFIILWRMTGNLWPSVFVAAVFAVHPLRVESVAWIAERKDVLSGLFFMLTLAAYLNYVRRPFSRARYLLVAVLFALGLMAKPMLVTLPFVLLLLDYWPLRRLTLLGDCPNFRPSENGTVPFDAAADSPSAGGLRPYWNRLRSSVCWRVVAEKIPLFALAALSCVATMLAQRDAMAALDVAPLSLRIGNALVAYIAYIKLFFLPTGLAVLYPYPYDGLPLWQVLASAAVLVGISLATWLGRRRLPYLFVGWFWYLGMLVPVIGLVQVGGQALADRYTYLPQIGLCIAIAWGAAGLAVAWPYRRWAFAAASLLIVAALMAGAFRQTAYWRDSLTLWQRALDCTEENSVAHNNYGMALIKNQHVEEAVGQFQKATSISPNFTMPVNNLISSLKASGQYDEAIAAQQKAQLLPHLAAIDHYRQALKIDPTSFYAHNNLGNSLVACGRFDEAVAEYRKALKLKEDYAPAHNNLANILLKQNKIDEALAQFRRSIELDPRSAKAHNNIGVILAKKGQMDDAVDQFQEALAIDPNFAAAHDNLGVVLCQQGKIADAMKHWEIMVKIQPNNVRAVNRLAWAMATHSEASVRNPAVAVELAHWAVQLSRNLDPVPLNTLAAAYARDGQYAKATRAANEALALATRQKDQPLADSIKDKIALYKANTPYQETLTPAPSPHVPSPGK
jgi:protein O-mannosyl-transferase